MESATHYTLEPIHVLMLSVLVLYLGLYLNRKIRLLAENYIPPAVTGGLWGASGFGETSGCGRRNRNWRTKEWIHRLSMMSVRSRRARRSAPIELAEASPWAGRRGDFRRGGNSKLSAG